MSLPLRLFVRRAVILPQWRGLAVAAAQATGSEPKLYKVREALNQALVEELERDENVIIIGLFLLGSF